MPVFGAIASTVVGALGARSAARSQSRAADAQITEQREAREQIRADLSPWREAGQNALAGYGFEVAGGARPEGWGGFEKSNDYNFRFNEGTNALNAMAGARGGLNSGRTMQDLTKFGQGFASTERGNWLSRLGGLADTGMNAAAMQGNATSNAAAGISNALANRGNAQSSGAIGISNAINGGIGNILGIMNYQRATAGPGGTLFGGNSWG